MNGLRVDFIKMRQTSQLHKSQEYPFKNIGERAMLHVQITKLISKFKSKFNEILILYYTKPANTIIDFLTITIDFLIIHRAKINHLIYNS